MPDADIKTSPPFWETYIGASGPPCIVFTATRGSWDDGVAIRISDFFLTDLHVDFVSTVITRNCTPPSKEFWISHASSWPLLEHVLLVPTTYLAFRDMLVEDAPSDGPRLPLLTKLTLIDDDTLTELKVSHLRDMLIERVEQGVPLEVLNLSTCVAADSSIQLLREIVVDVHDNEDPRRVFLEESTVLNWHGGIGYCYQVEDDYGRVPCPCDDEDEEDVDDDGDEEDDDDWM